MDAAPISAAADPVDPATAKAAPDVQLRRQHRPSPARQVPLLRRRRHPHRGRRPPHHCRLSLLPHLPPLPNPLQQPPLTPQVPAPRRRPRRPRRPASDCFSSPSRPSRSGSALIDSKAESWFCDALKSTKMMQRGQSADSGLVNGLMGIDSDSCVEAQVESLSNEVKSGLDLGSVPESMVLETSSSFGSTSSSISMLNFPPIAAHGDDGVVNLQEKKVKVLTPGSTESENSSFSALSHPQTAIYQDPVVHVPSMETRASSSAVEAASFAGDLASGIQMPKNVQLRAHQVPLQSDQIQHQQHMSYIQAGAHYIPQYSTGQFPISSYHPMYYSPMHQQTHNPYQPNPPYPVYLLPVRPPQSYNTSMQYNLLDTATTALSRPPMHPSTTTVTPPVPYKEVLAAAPLPELATKVYRTRAGPTPLIEVPLDQNQPPLVDLSEVHHPSQSVATASIAAANYDNEYEDDLAYTQIYKTQPSLPALLSQYQTMTGAGLVLSEASKLPHADSVKRHIGTSQPQ
ncbi:octicosapeptide/Phox/Bem1p family protein [Actinidia rufa]|uniref:Octicosapeptide/Phox/Bem1p family protein n=1 Tax=Actinidia rufa TaxID=165716 RepID=A0A7J0H741_9ERIC|nr:octicosapeptide/Phox/Bem1p family protein [Actinidia rufa]